MKYELTWKWDEFSKTLHFVEVSKFVISRPYRIYVLFTDKNATDKVYGNNGKSIIGIKSKIGLKNILYIGMVKYQRKGELSEYPMRIGERILFA